MADERYKYTAHVGRSGYSLNISNSNRLFLSVRSGIPEEVDWALGQLLAVSNERADDFILRRWPGSVEALFEVVEQWIADIARMEGESPDVARMLETPESQAIERRATDCLLVLRNAASVNDSNRLTIAEVMARPSDFAASRTFSLPTAAATTKRYTPPRLLLAINELIGMSDLPARMRLTMRSPEPIIYLLDLFQACMPQFCPGHPQKIVVPSAKPPHPRSVEILQRLMVDILPQIFLKCSDVGIICPLIQIYINCPQPFIPSLEVIGPTLLPFLLLTPTKNDRSNPSPYPRGLLLFTLDLLYTLTTNEAAALTLLRMLDMEGYIRTIVGLTGWNALHKPRGIRLRQDQVGLRIPLPQMNGRITDAQRDGANQAIPEDSGHALAGEPFGLGAVVAMAPEKRARLRSLAEPARCRAWITEVFTPQPQSSVTQVTFWTAYKEFTAPSSDDPAGPAIPPQMAAGDAIKVASEVFPGASAMVVNRDERGAPLMQPKFIVQGIRFKRTVGRRETYKCKWQHCTIPLGATSAAELQRHVETIHVPGGRSQERKCAWGTCTVANPTAAHVATHIPSPIDDSDEPRRKEVTVHASTAEAVLRSPFVTQRVPPPPPPSVKLEYTEILMPVTHSKHPVGEAFLASATLRNLARALRNDVERAAAKAEGRTSRAGSNLRRRLESGDAFGLPAPPDYIAAMLAEEGANVTLTAPERDRAVSVFRTIVERKALEIVENPPLAPYVLECIGF